MAHSPVFVLYMARCQHNVGKLVAAVRLLEDLLAEPQADTIPVSWRNALRDARAELDVLHRKVPSLLVMGDGIERVEASGAAAKGEAPLLLDPGEHVIRAWRKDGKTAFRRVVLREGERVVLVNMSFEAAVMPQPQRPPPPPAVLEGSGPAPATWITLAAGGAALVTGVVLGVIAKNKSNALLEQCDGNRCPEHLRDEADRADQWARASTAAFVIGGVDLAAGLTLLLAEP